jgi:hypothetical protein
MEGQGELRLAITERKERKFFSALPQASPGLAAAWWVGLLLLGVLPAAFAVAMGILIGAVESGQSLVMDALSQRLKLGIGRGIFPRGQNRRGAFSRPRVLGADSLCRRLDDPQLRVAI